MISRRSLITGAAAISAYQWLRPREADARLMVNQLTGFGVNPVAEIGGNDANTNLLLTMDEAAAAFTDTSIGGAGSPHAMTITSGVSSNVASKFGANCADFDGTSGNLIKPTSDSADHDPGAGDWTCDFWLMHTASSALNRIIFSGNDGSTFGYEFIIVAGVTVDAYWNSATVNLNGVTTIAQDTWAHIALERSSGTVTLFVDGNADDTLANSDSVASTAWELGNRASGGSDFIGLIDEFRLSDVARYGGAGFTPPAGPYT